MDERCKRTSRCGTVGGLNEWRTWPVIGTTRVLQAYVALGGTSGPHFPARIRWVLLESEYRWRLCPDGGRLFTDVFDLRALPNCSRPNRWYSTGELQKIARFVMDTYDGTTGCWGVHRGEKARSGMGLAGSPNALPVTDLALFDWRRGALTTHEPEKFWKATRRNRHAKTSGKGYRQFSVQRRVEALIADHSIGSHCFHFVLV